MSDFPIYACVEGKIVADDGGMITVETKRGLAYVITDLDFPLRLKVGDYVDFSDIRFVVADGVIEYMLDEDAMIFVNDYSATFKKRGGM